MTTDLLTTFLGWTLAVNIALLLIATLALFLMKGWALRLHSMISGLDEATLNAKYFDFLAGYKLLVLVFNFAPYLALRLFV